MILLALDLPFQMVFAAEHNVPFSWETVPDYAHLAKMSGGKPLGLPKGKALRKGWKDKREFAHATVFVEIETGEAKISWRQ